jgi:transposase
MVSAVRRGESQRSVARRLGVGLRTVQYWVRRADGRRLDRVDFADRPRGPQQPGNRTSPEMEDRVLEVRRDLKERSDLGEYGAEAVRRALAAEGLVPLPSVRTLGRIAQRRGALDGRRRVRRTAPPRGWYLPEVAQDREELDSFDVVEALAIKGGEAFELFSGVSLHGGLPCAFIVAPSVTARAVVPCLQAHWREVGLPGYAQFDNDTRFQGPHGHPDVISRTVRLCLSLGVTPVFVPPRETGFQAQVENFNGLWQEKVWQRFVFEDIPGLTAQSARYIHAKRARGAVRRDSAPARRPFPADWHLDLQATPSGHVIFIRRTSDAGHVRLLERTFLVDAHWPRRLVRCEVDLDDQRLRCYALRRQAPADQPLLADIPYRLKKRRRPFHE